ncbi:MAG TPA: thiamine-phosphate kinase [Rhodanobacteraceae bacterium]|nr:thiamine-phosphate kinase [Rhodanobacteraceae bacterium]
MEFELIDLLRSRLGRDRPDVRVGIGDDGAVIAVPAEHELVVSTDTLVAGVHFPLTTRAEDIGWKSLAVNLSDLAAMGATPAWALLALTLPSPDRAFVERFADGFGALAAQHRIALIGGDTTRGPLSIAVTVAGIVPAGRALLRSGARPGDAVFVTGTLGDAAAALRRIGVAARRESDADIALRERLDRPTPRIAAGLVLREAASACIDVSDGLIADLGHVALRSGVGIEIAASALPASAALLAICDAHERTMLQGSGGDDYELAFTLATSRERTILHDLAAAGCGATCIGRVVEERGVRLLDDEDREIALDRSGWEHFA